MTHEGKKVAIWRAINFRIFNFHIKNIIKHIPILSGVLNGWQLAAVAFAESSKGYRRKQQWKSSYGALINPKFASKWFKIMNSPDLLQVIPYRNRLYLKPFRVYMSIRWTKKQKVKVILDTYRFILSKGEEFKRIINSKNSIEIARFKLSDTIEGYLTLGYDERYRKEGELVFSFECDQLGGMIAAAAFSFEEIEMGRWVSRIACIQGLKTNDINTPKIAQKLLHGLRPKSFIVFIVQEFSRQLGLIAVYGAGDTIQAYRRKHAIHLQWWHAIQFDYDALWSESGGQRKSDGWYELPITPVRKSNQEIKTNKRALYSRRYSFLDDLSMKIAESVKRLVD